ncbi:MAG: hypothetical protein P4L83_10315 [Nevskia sp.]|nr:hypothetical protein [Nevskia sp.]
MAINPAGMGGIMPPVQLPPVASAPAGNDSDGDQDGSPPVTAARGASLNFAGQTVGANVDVSA